MFLLRLLPDAGGGPFFFQYHIMVHRWLSFPLFSARAQTPPPVDIGRRAHTNQTTASEPHSLFLLVLLLGFLGTRIQELNDDVVDV